MPESSFLLKRFRKLAIGAFFTVALCVGGAVFLTPQVHAQLAVGQNNVEAVAEASGIQSTSLTTIIGRLINIFLGTLGVVFLCLMLYAGYLWMTAQGDGKQVDKARSIIRNAIIGLVITMASYAITAFIFSLLAGDGLGSLGGGSQNQVGGFTPSAPGSGCLGSGIIEMHIPARNESDVYRNTSIVITFKEAIRPDSFISGWTEQTSSTSKGLNSDLVKVYPGTDEAGALGSSAAYAFVTADHKTFVIKPVKWLGNDTTPTDYAVKLKSGSSGIKKEDGSAAFSGGACDSDYTWQFKVSTKLDLIPPTVWSALPTKGGVYARNIISQVYFSRPLDPTATTGDNTAASNILIESAPVGSTNFSPVPGEWRISNQYQTMEFVPSASCDGNTLNSCGRKIYCLPGNSTIRIRAKAASITPPGPQAVLTSNGYDGVVSITGNSLDGNKDGKTQGPDADNYEPPPSSWTFATDATIKLNPPKIEKTEPVQDPLVGYRSAQIPLDQPVIAYFDSILQSSTLNTDSISVNVHGATDKQDSFWYSIASKLTKNDGTEIDTSKEPPEIPTKSKVLINHRVFMPSGTDPAKNNYYDPYLTSQIQDAYQNCFNPAATCAGGATDKLNPNCCNGKPYPENTKCKDPLKI